MLFDSSQKAEGREGKVFNNPLGGNQSSLTTVTNNSLSLGDINTGSPCPKRPHGPHQTLLPWRAGHSVHLAGARSSAVIPTLPGVLTVNTVPHNWVTSSHKITFTATSEPQFCYCYESPCKFLMCRTSNICPQAENH